MILAVALSSFTAMAQQSFGGFRNGYYSGTHRILSNPSSIAGSPRKFDVNLFSLSTNISNDQLNVSLSNFTDIDKIVNESIKSNSFSNFSGNLNLDVLGPSFMLALGERHSLGITSRVRVLGNIDNFNVKLFQTLLGDIEKVQWSGSTTRIFEKNQSLNISAFGELGATWASTIIDTDNHQLKAGATLKYVRGAANIYMGIQNLDGSLSYNETTKEATITASGSLSAVNSGVDFNSFKVSDATKAATTGVGFDIGVTYEYRPEPDAPYKFKVGAAITDIGSLSYTPIKDYGFIYTLSSATITYKDDFQKKLNEIVAKTEVGTYQASLPTAFHANIDYHICYGIFLELAGQFGLTKNDAKLQNPYYGTDFTFTPRWENKSLGVYVPFNYNNLSKLNVGTAVRLGPLVAGSNSLLTAASGKSKQIDVFVGLRFGL